MKPIDVIRYRGVAGATGGVTLTDYSVSIFSSGGGSVTFGMLSDGTTTGDASGWFSPPAAGVGTGRWVVITSTGGTLAITGSAVGSRIQLSTDPSWTGTYSGSAVRFRTFSVEVYDASVGGNLLGSGTLTLEVEGT